MLMPYVFYRVLCYGLQKMLDICAEYGIKWDIRLNSAESQLMTIGGRDQINSAARLGKNFVQWVPTVKYLGLHPIGGKDFKFDFTVAKRKYYGGFNTIKTSVGRQVNEIMLLHLVKTYCLPRLLYSCEIWPLNTVNMHELDVIWNNCYRHVLIAAGRKVLNHFSTIVRVCRCLI